MKFSAEATRRKLREQLLLATLGGVFVGFGYLFLPERLTVGPSWLLLVIEAVFVLPLLVSFFVHPFSPRVVRLLRLGLQGLLAVALVSSVVQLVLSLHTISRGSALLIPASILWVSNIIIYAEWYWEIDGGGPYSRHQLGHTAVDFLFPQQQGGKAWAACFVDYLFLAFCFATALSPADTAPLTQRAKLLMMAEAIMSLLLIVLVVSRSVNIL